MSPPAAAAASTKRSAWAALKDDNTISSIEETQAQFSNNKSSNYTNNDPPPAAAKRPALDCNKIAVVTPAKSIKSTKVFVKDLRDLAQNNNSHLNNLKNYVPDESANPSNNSSSDIALSQSESGNNDNKLLGPIFCLWCDCSTMNNHFVKSATNFFIAEFCVLYFQTADIIQSKWNVGSG